MCIALKVYMMPCVKLTSHYILHVSRCDTVIYTIVHPYCNKPYLLNLTSIFFIFFTVSDTWILIFFTRLFLICRKSKAGRPTNCSRPGYVRIMEAIVAVLRPKCTGVISGEFRAKSYEILLMESRILNRDKVKTMKQLPTTNILLDNEPSDALCAFLFRFTGAEAGGLKGLHSVVHV